MKRWLLFLLLASCSSENQNESPIQPTQSPSPLGPACEKMAKGAEEMCKSFASSRFCSPEFTADFKALKMKANESECAEINGLYVRISRAMFGKSFFGEIEGDTKIKPIYSIGSVKALMQRGESTYDFTLEAPFLAASTSIGVSIDSFGKTSEGESIGFRAYFYERESDLAAIRKTYDGKNKDVEGTGKFLWYVYSYNLFITVDGFLPKKYVDRIASIINGKTNTPNKGRAEFLGDFEIVKKEYAENELAADDKYKGKYWVGFSYVGKVERLFGSVYVRLEGTEEGFDKRVASCQVPKEKEKELLSLKTGQGVFMRGKITGAGILDVQLEDCTLMSILP